MLIENKIMLNNIINEESFDDCICSKDEMVTYETKINNNFLKKIFVDESNNFYFRSIKSNKMIKMISLNMSWVPIYFFEQVFGRLTNFFGRPQNFLGRPKNVFDVQIFFGRPKTFYGRPNMFWTKKHCWTSKNFFRRPKLFLDVQ